MSGVYSESEERIHVANAIIRLRHLFHSLGNDQDVDIAIALPLLRELRTLTGVAKSLKDLLTNIGIAEMNHYGISELEVNDWTITRRSDPDIKGLDGQGVADEVLSVIEDRLLRRFRKQDPEQVKAIAREVYWTVMTVATPRWKATTLKTKLNIDLGKYGKVEMRPDWLEFKDKNQ